MTGAELRELREKAELSQDALAEGVGWTGKHRAVMISRYESGRRGIPTQTAQLFKFFFESRKAAAK